MKMREHVIAVLLVSAAAMPLQVQADPPWGWDGPGESDCGMMGPGMMGRGMGCRGMGYMMGGPGPMGPGMMMGGYGMLDLTDKQIDKINDIQTSLQKDHWKLMGEMIDAQARVRKAWSQDRPDPQEVGAAYGKLYELQRRGIEQRVAAMNRIYDSLTDEQRKLLKSGPRHMWGQGGGGPMGRGHMMMR